MRIGVVRRLAARFARSGPVRPSALALTIAAMVLVLSFTTLQSLGLSRAQLADRDLAGYDGSVQSLAPVRDDGSVATAVEDALEGAGASRVMTELMSYDLHPDYDSSQLLVYLENEWAQGARGDRFELADGRWPTRPGEVVVTEPVAARANGPELVVMSGRTRLDVVGTVEDRYGRRANEVLGAPGTWAGQNWKEIAPAFPNASATPTFFWSGITPDEAIAAVAAATQADEEGEAAIRLSMASRDALLADPSQSMVDGYPLAFTVPSWVLPIVLPVLAMLGAERRSRPALEAMRGVGIRTREAATALWLGAASRLVVAAFSGVVAGAVLGWLIRPILARVANQPLSDYPWPWMPSLRILGLTLATAVVSLLVAILRRRRTRTSVETAFAVPNNSFGAVRTVFAAVLIIAVLWGAQTVSTLFGLIPLTVVLALLVGVCVGPLVRAVAARLPDSGPRRRLAKRQLQMNHRQAVTAVTAIALMGGMALTMLVLIASVQATARTLLATPVASGQVQLTTGNLFGPPPDDVVRVAEEAAPTAIEIKQFVMGTPDKSVDARPDGLGSVLALETADEIELLCGTLPPPAGTTLNDGGAVFLDSTPDDPTPLWYGEGNPTAAIPATHLECPGWSSQTAALTLTSTAKALDLPMTLSSVVLVDVDTATARGIRDAVEAAGYPANLVQFAEPPDAPATPLAALLAAAVACIFAGITVGTAIRSQTRELRSLQAGMRALGLGSTWSAGVLTLQTVYIVVAGLALALVVALVPALVGGLQLDDASVVIPWPSLALGTLLIFLPTAIQILTRRTSARGR